MSKYLKSRLALVNAKTAPVLGALTLAAGSAMADPATDYGAAAGITGVQTTALAIIGGFITMGIAVWGASYILRRFFPKGK